MLSGAFTFLPLIILLISLDELSFLVGSTLLVVEIFSPYLFLELSIRDSLAPNLWLGLLPTSRKLFVIEALGYTLPLMSDVCSPSFDDDFFFSYLCVARLCLITLLALIGLPMFCLLACSTSLFLLELIPIPCNLSLLLMFTCCCYFSLLPLMLLCMKCIKAGLGLPALLLVTIALEVKAWCW